MNQDIANAISKLPLPFQPPVAGVVGELLRTHPDVVAFMLVGSVAEGDWDEHSDIDFLYVRQPIIEKDRIVEIKKLWPIVHFIAYTPDRLAEAFGQQNTMAWSIARGLPLFDGSGIIAHCKSIPLAAPGADWVREHMKRVLEWPDEPQSLWRKVINLAILYTAARGDVATTKRRLVGAVERSDLADVVKKSIDLIFRARCKEGIQISDVLSLGLLGQAMVELQRCILELLAES